jgi:hypothetical protein
LTLLVKGQPHRRSGKIKKARAKMYSGDGKIEAVYLLVRIYFGIMLGFCCVKGLPIFGQTKSQGDGSKK